MNDVFDVVQNLWFFSSVIALGLILRGWPRLKPVAVELPVGHLCRDLSTARPSRAIRIVLALGTAALVFLVYSLSGPRGNRIETSTEGITLALVVDISGSMATADFSLDGQSVSRLAGVQSVFRLLVVGGTTSERVFPGRPNDLIALITFATRPETACPPTFDHAALLSILDRQMPKTLVTEATTNPGDALAWALAALERAPTRRKVIIFLTDGESNVGSPALSPRQAGQLAANLKIPIYAIDALDDAESGTDAPKAHKTLADLATMTGGQHFRATDAAALRQALHDLDRLERDAIARPDRIVDASWAMQSALLAFACWLAYLIGGATRGRILP